MKKRIISLLLASALLSALMAGCGNTDTSSSAPVSTPASSGQKETAAPAPTTAPQPDSAEDSSGLEKRRQKLLPHR